MPNCRCRSPLFPDDDPSRVTLGLWIDRITFSLAAVGGVVAAYPAGIGVVTGSVLIFALIACVPAGAIVLTIMRWEVR